MATTVDVTTAEIEASVTTDTTSATVTTGSSSNEITSSSAEVNVTSNAVSVNVTSPNAITVNIPGGAVAMSTEITATVDGLDTGLIGDTVIFANITSSDAAYFVTFPAASVGKVLRGAIGATGCILKTAETGNFVLPPNCHFVAESFSGSEWVVTVDAEWIEGTDIATKITDLLVNRYPVNLPAGYYYADTTIEMPYLAGSTLKGAGRSTVLFDDVNQYGGTATRIIYRGATSSPAIRCRGSHHDISNIGFFASSVVNGINGVDDGAGNNATVCTDTSQEWTVDSLIGRTILNTTDFSRGVITDNDATTVTVASLTGGTDNDFDIGDSFTIVPTPVGVGMLVTNDGGPGLGAGKSDVYGCAFYGFETGIQIGEAEGDSNCDVCEFLRIQFRSCTECVRIINSQSMGHVFDSMHFTAYCDYAFVIQGGGHQIVRNSLAVSTPITILLFTADNTPGLRTGVNNRHFRVDNMKVDKQVTDGLTFQFVETVGANKAYVTFNRPQVSGTAAWSEGNIDEDMVLQIIDPSYTSSSVTPFTVSAL